MKKKIFYIVLTMIISSAVVVALFLTSEHIMKRENPFVRRFMPHHIDKAEYMDLEVNSYYIAGLTNDTIYLGNYTAPLLITAVPTNMGTKVEHQIKLDETQRSFRSLTIKVQGQEFFVTDGTIPIIYKGSTNDWKAKRFMEEKIYFSLLQSMTDDSFLFRSQRASTGEHVLGRLQIKIQPLSNCMMKLCKNKSTAYLIRTDSWLPMQKPIKVCIPIITVIRDRKSTRLNSSHVKISY